ncbi:MAG: SRPBCC domain-containing protein [Polyangiaceae bacterium]
MSTLTIEERIKVHAPPKRVWKFLLDPARVAACLPGAKLDGTEGEDTFLGTMKVKVGPVMMEIKGKATMSEVDPVARKVTLTGTGNDKAGGGSARMDMKSEIIALEDGGSEILVLAEVHLAGKLVRFGRGMMEGISKQLFKQFAERVHAALDEDDEEEEEESATPEGGESAEDDGAAPESPPAEAKDEKPAPAEAKTESAPEKAESAPEKSEPTETKALAPAEKTEPAETKAEPVTEEAKATTETTSEEAAPPAKTEEAPVSTKESKPAETKDEPAAKTEEAPAEEAESKAPAKPEEATSKEVAPEEKKAAPAKKKASTSPGPAKKKNLAKRPAPAEDNAPLDAGGLMWAALWAWIRGFFSRIFGGGKKD